MCKVKAGDRTWVFRPELRYFKVCWQQGKQREQEDMLKIIPFFRVGKATQLPPSTILELENRNDIDTRGTDINVFVSTEE